MGVGGMGEKASQPPPLARRPLPPAAVRAATVTAAAAAAAAPLPRSEEVVGEVLARVANPTVGPESPIEALDTHQEERPQVRVRVAIRVDVVHELPEPHRKPVVRRPRVWAALVNHGGCRFGRF